MSVAGVARDLAAYYEVPFAIPTPDIGGVAAGPPASSLVTVEVVDEDGCGRFTARVLQGVTVGAVDREDRQAADAARHASDQQRRRRVELRDARARAAVAPLRPRAGRRGRSARARARRTARRSDPLDDVERKLTAEDLLICDANDRPNGIAGIMGGATPRSRTTTTEVLVEMAWFDPMTIAQGVAAARPPQRGVGSLREGLRSARSSTSPRTASSSCSAARCRQSPGIVDVRGRSTHAADGAGPHGAGQRHPRHANSREQRSVTCSSRSGSRPRRAGDDHDVTIPSWRIDTATEIDVIEEVGRMYGYERIGAVVPPSVHSARSASGRTSGGSCATCSSASGSPRRCRCRSSRRAT